MSEDPRIPEIREAMSDLDQWEHDSAHRVVERIRDILDPPAPAPRVACGRPDDACGLRGGSAHCGGCRG